MARPSFDNRNSKTTKPNVAVAKTTATPVRNTAIPKAKSASAPRTITQEMIARRAFEISCGPQCGSETDNWLRAERELQGL